MRFPTFHKLLHLMGLRWTKGAKLNSDGSVTAYLYCTKCKTARGKVTVPAIGRRL